MWLLFRLYARTESEEINLTEILLPNVFSVLINEDGKIGETERALTHIDRYVNEFGFEPNVYLYTGMWPQQKRKKEGDALMASVHVNPLPMLSRPRSSLFMCGQAGAISAVGKARSWRKCTELFQEMKKNGVQPNAVTYFSMVMILGQNGQGQTALQYFEDMRVRDSAQCKTS